MQLHPLMHAAINTAEAFPGGLTALAAALEIPYNTLYAQLHGVGHAKLGGLTMLSMIDRTQDPRMLHTMEELSGYLPSIRRPQLLTVAGDEAMAHVARTMKEVADVAQQVCARINKPNGLNDNDMEVIEREWGEAMIAGTAMMAHLRAMREARKPSHLHEVRAA